MYLIDFFKESACGFINFLYGALTLKLFTVLIFIISFVLLIFA